MGEQQPAQQRRRQFGIKWLLGLTAVAAILAWLFLAPRGNITETEAHSVRNGMTKLQILWQLGRPASIRFDMPQERWYYRVKADSGGQGQLELMWDADGTLGVHAKAGLKSQAERQAIEAKKKADANP